VRVGRRPLWALQLSAAIAGWPFTGSYLAKGALKLQI